MNERNTTLPNGSTAYQSYTPGVEQERDSAKILMLGGVAAGIISGLVVLLSEREKKEPQSLIDQARHAIEDAAARAKSEAELASTDLASSLQGARGDAKKKSAKANKRGAELSKKAQKDTNEAMEKINKLLVDARKEAGSTAKDLRRQAPDLNEISKQVRSYTDDATKDAKKRGEKLRKQASDDAGKAKAEMSSLVDVLKAKASDVEKLAESYVESTLLPKLKDLEQEATGMIETGKDVTKAKTKDLRDHAEKDLIPDAKDRAKKLRKHAEEDLVPKAKENIDRLKINLNEQAQTTAENLEKSSSKALADAKEQASRQAKEAGESVKRGGRETRSLLLWLGLAGTIVYSVFLNDDQQRKVRELGSELFGEAKDIYSDIKGADDSLSA